MTRRSAFAAVFAALGAAAIANAAPAAAPVASDVAALFPAGAGHDTTLRVCSQCHSPVVAAQQHLSPEAWKAIVEQMAGLGAPGTDAELAEITAYLAKSFPAETK